MNEIDAKYVIITEKDHNIARSAFGAHVVFNPCQQIAEQVIAPVNIANGVYSGIWGS